MRLLAFTDTHGDTSVFESMKRKIEGQDVDMALCCGDMTNFGRNQKEMVDAIASLRLPTLLIHGNHETPESLEKDCQRHEHLIFLHSSAYRVDNHIILGYGGDGFSLHDKSFKNVSKKFKKDIKKDDKIIVMFHGPPNGVLDVNFTSNTGNKDYRDFIDEVKPDLVLCGHIHESSGMRKILGKTKVVNPGPVGMILEV